MRTTLYNQIRGLMKTFGMVLAPGKGGAFVREVEAKMPSDPAIQAVVGSLLSVWKTITFELTKLDSDIGPLHVKAQCIGIS
jgi:transposase